MSCVICSQMSIHPSLAEHVQLSGMLSVWMGTDSCHSSKIRQRPLFASTFQSIFAPAVSVNSSGLWHSSFMCLSSVAVVHSLCYVMWYDNWRCGKHLRSCSTTAWKIEIRPLETDWNKACFVCSPYINSQSTFSWLYRKEHFETSHPLKPSLLLPIAVCLLGRYIYLYTHICFSPASCDSTWSWLTHV